MVIKFIINVASSFQLELLATYRDIFILSCAGSLAHSCLTLSITHTVAHQAPLSMGFLRQEYRSGLPFSPPGNLLDPKIEAESPGRKTLPYTQ